MNLLMIGGDRSILQGKKGAFWYTLEKFHTHWDRIDVLCPHAVFTDQSLLSPFPNVFFHPSPHGLWYQMRWIVRKGKELIDVHHHAAMTVHEFPPFYTGFGGMRLHRMTGVPFLLEVFHIEGYPIPGSLTEWIGKALSRMVIPIHARSASTVRCICRPTMDLLMSWGVPAEKCAIISAFYLDRKALVADSSIPKTTSIVASARLVRNKGIDRLLRALVRIPSATLLIIGDGPERRALEALSRTLGIAERVMFSGWLPGKEDVYGAMQTAHVFVCSSLSEGGPRVALEAMALGIPVVTTKVGIMGEVIDDGVNGVFTEGTPADIAQKLRGLLSDDALRGHMGNAAKGVLDQFERGDLIRAYADFLKGIAKEYAKSGATPCS